MAALAIEPTIEPSRNDVTRTPPTETGVALVKWRRIVRTFFLLGALFVASAGCQKEPLDVAPNVDLRRFQGSWYEIAKLPRPTEANCTATTARYTLRDESTL